MDIKIYKLDGDAMIIFNSNFKKYLLILPIYNLYCSIGEIVIGFALLTDLVNLFKR